MNRHDPDPLVSRGGSLMEAEVDGEMVGLHVESGTCYGFNGTAYRIWQLLDQPVRLSQLCAALSEEYDVSPDVCETEVRLLLDDLGQSGLVTLSRL
ncbi:PqqD family protein [Sphingomonas psychrotolerans]|uniref:PqqD family protein n=1 Tax=Sphingomonas psychrotolerans TaxID=1327635 RepID=A0ABU3N7J8_9SPHN|nr:PqqD family protein [Sphingomonas psychrotolerans]MDT8759752.1 PqqD family protein [Sphingomonas psychrotolerans]